MGLEETQQELMEEIDREYAEELRKEEKYGRGTAVHDGRQCFDGGDLQGA